MPDFVERVNWQEYMAVLEQGEPTIAMQLIIVNAALLVFWVMRRARGGKAPRRNAWLLPMMFAGCNIAVFSLGDRLAIHI